MKRPNHRWIKQEGFKHHKCKNCGTTRIWVERFGQCMYYDNFRLGPLYFPPQCRFVMITDVPIKM